jgi:mannose-6-phosphate isomerase-like protein (cupin superfamily)
MKISLLCLFAVALLVARAQDTVPEGFEHWTAASLMQLDQTLKGEAGASPQHIAARQLSDFPNDKFMLSRREADGTVEWHENQVDVFFVESGAATLIVGGTMVGGATTEPHEKRGGSIKGGIRRRLSPGDVVRIPARMPHQLLLDGSRTFTYFVIKVKGY